MLWRSSGECAGLGWDAVELGTGCGLVMCALEHEGVGFCGSLGIQKLAESWFRVFRLFTQNTLLDRAVALRDNGL